MGGLTKSGRGTLIKKLMPESDGIDGVLPSSPPLMFDLGFDDVNVPASVQYDISEGAAGGWLGEPGGSPGRWAVGELESMHIDLDRLPGEPPRCCLA